jgi:hypothetical protein
MRMSEPGSLREFLIKEFGIELPIQGGTGTEDAPIVITATDLQDAVDVQMQVLGCLGSARRVAWRLKAQEVTVAEQRIVQATIETVGYASQAVIAVHEAIYFGLEALPASSAATALPVATEFVDSRSGVRLPQQLGWLHRGHATDNEPADPGLGWTVTYDALTMKGTVYIYDRGEPLATDDVESERVIGEFQMAVDDALEVNSGAEVKHQAVFRDPAGCGRCLLAVLDVPGDSMSAVMLTVRNGCFVKGRVTFDATERQFGRIAHESIEAFVDALRPEPAMTS